MGPASGPGNGTRAKTPFSGEQSLWLAGLVCPVSSPPIEKGAVLTRDGRVVAVGPAEEIRPADGLAKERDFGGGILIPGMVNAHTHMELSGMKLDPSPIADWIVRLVREQRTWYYHLFLSSAQIGVSASLNAGVTCVGDISNTGHSPTILGRYGLRGVVFFEVLGLDPGEAESIVKDRVLARADMSRMKGMRDGFPETLRRGTSPHAPYTASIPLYEAALAAGRDRGWQCATHLAESPEESHFLKDGGGPLAEMHKSLESPVEGFKPPGCAPVRYLADAGVLEGISLAIHCNQTGEEDWALLREAKTAVCLCPRSAAYFGHPFADAAGMRKAGVRLCLGTDSLASSPSLSLLAEAVALREAAPDLAPEEILEMCTISGAEALGFADEGVGQLRPGGVADFAVVDPPPGKKTPELADLFHPEAEVRATFIGGERRFERER